FFFQAEDGIRDRNVTGVQTCALPILQYRLWFLWLAFLFVPFLPVDLSGLSLPELICDSVSQVGEGTAALTEKASGAFSISGDYAVSVSSGSFGSLNKILLLAWTAGTA